MFIMEEAFNFKKTILEILQANSLTFDDLKKIGAIKIKNDGYLDLNIDYLGTYHQYDRYAVAHNFIQNSDLMADPDMEFLDIQGAFVPISYQLDSLGVYHRAVTENNGTLQWNRKMYKDLLNFIKMWANNLKIQGFKKGTLYIEGMTKDDWLLKNKLVTLVQKQYKNYKGYTDSEEQLRLLLRKYNKQFRIDENNELRIINI